MTRDRAFASKRTGEPSGESSNEEDPSSACKAGGTQEKTASLVEAGEQDLRYPRFRPHALAEPTLFRTDDANLGGVAIGGGGSMDVPNIGGSGARDLEESGGPAVPRGQGQVRDSGPMECDHAEGRLLDAREKIHELEGLVESSRSDNSRWQ